jgi:hypothetical protein
MRLSSIRTRNEDQKMLVITRSPMAIRRVVLAAMVAITCLGAAAAALPDPAQAACYGSTYVSGHFRSNGTYVVGHWRTCPDSTRTNNYSYPGNYNPNTGRVTSGSSYSRSTPSYSRSTPSYSRSTSILSRPTASVFSRSLTPSYSRSTSILSRPIASVFSRSLFG